MSCQRGTLPRAVHLLMPCARLPQGVLADVSIATGYVTIALMLGGRFVFQYFGWQVRLRVASRGPCCARRGVPTAPG